MMFRKIFWITSTALLLAASGLVLGNITMPSVAHACSLPPPGVHSRRVAPEDGANGVPTNTEIVIEYCWERWDEKEPTELGDFTLRAVGGADVEVVVVAPLAQSGVSCWLWLIKPIAPLVPNTRYELLDRFAAIPCGPVEVGSDPACDGAADYSVAATFTTGAGADTTAPSFAGGSTPTEAQHDICDQSACCGPYDVVRSSLSWSEASDDSTPPTAMRYLAFAADDLSRPLATYLAASSVVVGRLCSGSEEFVHSHAGVGTNNDSLALIIRAMDLAGNQDTNTHVLNVALNCEVTPSPDAGAVADSGVMTDSGVSDPGDKGCSLGGDELEGGLGMTLALMVLVALRRRRR